MKQGIATRYGKQLAISLVQCIIIFTFEDAQEVSGARKRSGRKKEKWIVKK